MRETAGGPDRLVGGIRILAGGPDPSAPELQDVERVPAGRVHQGRLRFGLQDGRPADLLDRGLGEPARPDSLVGGGQGAVRPPGRCWPARCRCRWPRRCVLRATGARTVSRCWTIPPAWPPGACRPTPTARPRRTHREDERHRGRSAAQPLCRSAARGRGPRPKFGVGRRPVRGGRGGWAHGRRRVCRRTSIPRPGGALGRGAGEYRLTIGPAAPAARARPLGKGIA
jgi:hypothetical protein